MKQPEGEIGKGARGQKLNVAFLVVAVPGWVVGAFIVCARPLAERLGAHFSAILRRSRA